MKRLCVYALFFILTLISVQVFAEETATISLSAPPTLGLEACRTPVWNNVKAVWGGVTDKRNLPEVGLQTQKGKEPIPIMASPPLEEVWDKALKTLLSACGMQFVTREGEDALKLSAEIREFYAGVEKKLVTGKSQAKSNIAFSAQHGNESMKVVVGFEIDSKKIRAGNIKQLTQTLNELFTETLKQIPATQEMKEIGK